MSDLKFLPEPYHELQAEELEYYNKIGNLLIAKGLWENIYISMMIMYAMEIVMFNRIRIEYDKNRRRTSLKKLLFSQLEGLKEFKEQFLISDSEAISLNIPFGMEIIKIKMKI